MAKIPLFPAYILWEHKDWHFSDTLVKGAIVNILFAWWCARCPALPPMERMKALSGMNDNRWQRHKTNILSMLNDIIPLIQAKHDKLNKTYQYKLHHMNNVNNKLKQRRLSKQTQQDKTITLSENNDHTPVMLPYKSDKPNKFTPEVIKPKTTGSGFLREKPPEDKPV